MLGKMFKQDFRALSRILFPLQIGVLAGGLVATLLLRLTLVLSHVNVEKAGGAIVVNGMVMGISGTIAVLICVALMASILVTLIMILLHFYRNLMGNEGYLTFTLPVSTSTILWSKVITGVLWLIINFAVVCLAGLIILVFGTTATSFMSQDALEFLSSCFRIIPQANQVAPMGLLIPEVLLFALVMVVSQLMELYFAIVVGGQMAKKNKVLAAIGMYLVINLVVGIVKQVFTFGSLGLFGLGSMAFNTAEGFSGFAAATMGWYILLHAALFVGFFFWSRHLLSHDLNLQ